MSQAMPGANSGNNTYTCTCTRFCRGYKTGLSRATFYRHAPYRDAPQPGFSASFQAFLNNSSAPGPSTGSNLAADDEDGTFNNEVEQFQQKVGSLTLSTSISVSLTSLVP
jgi:hypothetical protein